MNKDYEKLIREKFGQWLENYMRNNEYQTAAYSLAFAAFKAGESLGFDIGWEKGREEMQYLPPEDYYIDDTNGYD